MQLVRRWQGRPARQRVARLVAALRRDTALRARPVVQLLARRGAQELRVLWGPGVVCAWASASSWDEVARLSGVAHVFDDSPRSAAEIDDASGGPNRSAPPQAPLVSLRIPEAWERGMTGRGIVVALIDTGVDMSHPDLAQQIWTNTGEIPDNGIDDDGNGYVDDIHGWDFASNDNNPSDSSGHGTSAAGLLAGNGASGKQTGGAPDVRLMVLRRGTTQAALWEASQYAIDNGARIVSQSTSWKWSFGTDYASWRRQADAELAAGVVHVNSAGNTGEQQASEPIPYNIAAPALCPPPWHHPEQQPQNGLSSTLGVGNVDARSLKIVSSSPYGPSEWTDIVAHRDPAYAFTMPPEYQDYPTWDSSPGLGKPDLVAPGDASLSAALGGGYRSFGGTSAAAPRVASILALMLQAVPRATPAELTRALLESCRDMGPPGRDLRFGAGLPDARAAIDHLGPPIRIVVAELIDPNPPRGDGDRAADEGEIDRLRIVLENTSGQTLEGVELILRAREQAIVRDGFAVIATLPAGGTAETSAPHLSVELPKGSCGRTARLELEIRQGGQARVEGLFLGVGTEIRTSLLETDFESSASFSTAGDATAGEWVRELPTGTSAGNEPANPAEDHTAPPGVIAWVTGNGPTDPDAADVDHGTTRLVSPSFDGTGYDEVELVYYRWFFASDALGEDRYFVEASNDGQEWTLVEELSAPDNLWRRRRVVLSDLLVLGRSLRLRFSVEDAGGDDTVEGGLDDLVVTGIRLDCQPWTIPPDGGADPVGSSLRLRALSGGHVELSWNPPSVSGGKDPVHGYRVTRSSTAQGGFSEIARPTQTRGVDVDGLSGAPGTVAYYLVDSL